MQGQDALTKYPIYHPSSIQYQTLVESARHQLQTTGCASFPHFLTSAALATAAKEAATAATAAFVTDSRHNAFQLPDLDAQLPDNHPRNVLMRTRVASVAYDELDRRGPLYQLYNSSVFLKFVKDVTHKEQLYRLADPLGACTVNVFRPGWFHAWHFDESEYTTTLCLQQSDQGGAFEFTAPLRHDQSIAACSEAVAAVINAHSQYASSCGGGGGGGEPPAVHTANFQPGTLQIFAGRYSFHRVAAIPTTSKKDRLVAVLCFSSEPNVVNSSSVQEMFWGRRGGVIGTGSDGQTSSL